MKSTRAAANLIVYTIAAVFVGALVVKFELPLQFLVALLAPVVVLSVDNPRSIYLPMAFIFTGVAVWAAVNLSPNIENSLQTILATLVLAVATCEIVSWLAGRKRYAEEALRESEEKYRDLFENANDMIYTHDLSGRFISINRAGEAITGYTAADLPGLTLEDVVPEEHLEQARERVRQKLTDSVSTRYEAELIAKDGRRVPMEVSTRPILRNGQPVAVQGIARDITERKKAEEALRASEERYRLIFEGSRDGIVFLDTENRREFANHRLVEIHDYTEEELEGKSVMSFVHPEDLPRIQENNRRRLAGESFEHTYEFRLIHKDGHPVDVEGTFNAIKRDDKVIGVCGIIRDISARKRTEAELELIHAYAPCILWRGDVELRDGKYYWSIRVVNPEAAQRLLPIEQRPDEDYFDALAKNRWEFKEETRQLDKDAARAFSEGESHLQHSFPCRRIDGEIRWIYEDAYIQAAGPERWQVVGVSTDITDRRKGEEEIKQALSLLAATLESTADGILVVDFKGKVLSYNKKFLDLWRIPTSVVETNDDSALLQFVLDQLSDPKGFLEKVQELYAHPERESHDTVDFKDGRVFERFSQPQWIDGKSVGRVWSFRDVTERKKAEEDRLLMERQMQQAQQLESLGVLAGGIAHDFNNILMAILGHADLALDEISPSSPVHDSLQEIEKASRRAAELCRQMLAYSGRGKFVVDTMALCDLIDEMAHLLRTSISKNAVLNLNLDRQAPLIRGDATQIRQIILNLIVNASEAVAERGGAITVTTGTAECARPDFADTILGDDLPEGLYVCLEVSDTGSGMDKETLEHIFEPFFTTKFTGRGLGLSAVLGIVRGHRAALSVRSEVGKGTTFRILFPAAEGNATAFGDEDLLVEEAWRGTGKILLVDDEETVRVIGKRMLERLGYEVLTANDGREALRIYRDQGKEIDLVLLDLTMPNMNGEAAHRELRRLDPGVRVILSSGYTEQDVAMRFERKHAVRFLQKPYTLAALRDCLRLSMPTDPAQE